MERFEGRFRTQYDDGPLETENCTPASLAMALSQVSEGRINMSGTQVRALIKKNEEVDPKSAGWALADIDLAMNRLPTKGFATSVRASKKSTWARLVELRSEGRGIVLQGDSSKFDNTTCSGAFNGPHCVYVSPIDDDDGDWRLGDPVCSKWRWETAKVLRAYAESFAGSGKARFRFTDTIALLQPLQTFTWSADARLGNLTIDKPRVYLRLADNSLHAVQPPFAKRALGPIRLRTPFHGVTSATDRVTGYLVNDEAAFVLAEDVTFDPDA